MIKIAFIVPNKNLVDLVFKTYQEHTQQYLKYSSDDIQYSFSVYVAATIKQVTPQALDADILIARGMLVTKLKEKYPHTAVVELPIGSELVPTIYQATQQYGSLPIVVMGSFNMVYAAHGIEDVLDVNITTYLQTSNDPKEINRCLDIVLVGGPKIVVCGPNTFEFAKLRDCFPVLLGISKESIWQAITEAKHGAVIKREEREKTLQFQTVLNYAYEGIIATDLNGKISVFNAAAEDILHMKSKDVLGRRIDNILPRGHLCTVLRGKTDYTDTILPYNGEYLSVNKVSILLSGDFVGHVITLQRSSTIQKTESKLREKLYGKGHVARYHFSDLIGSSPSILHVIENAINFASVTSNILITGATGTGKELFAQSIHNESVRKDAPFVAINCAALSKSLLESELFGYVEGAFTGAAKGGKPGIFELAHTGTIFLDEISEIPLDLQGRLLRVLQERQIMRLGDDKVIPIDVRIISASNKPLLAQVRGNEFRRDLYYRLNVLTLYLPSLNERKTDILQLAVHFLEEYCTRFQKPPITLSDKACTLLMEHHWDGNIRELKNVCECLAVLNKTGTITEADLEPLFSNSEPVHKAQTQVSYAEDFKKFERDRIEKAIENCGGDKDVAAKSLGISRTTLWRRMKTLGIKV